MNDDHTQTDFKIVKGDVKRLFADVGSWISTTSADMRQRWEETRPVLEDKLATAEAEAKRLGSASAGAAGEMGKGFAGAFAELKKAYGEARARFAHPDTEEEEEEGLPDEKEDDEDEDEEE